MNIHVTYVFLVLLKISKEMIKEHFSKKYCIFDEAHLQLRTRIGIYSSSDISSDFRWGKESRCFSWWCLRLGLSFSKLKLWIVNHLEFNYLLCPFLQCKKSACFIYLLKELLTYFLIYFNQAGCTSYICFCISGKMMWDLPIWWAIVNIFAGY